MSMNYISFCKSKFNLLAMAILIMVLFLVAVLYFIKDEKTDYIYINGCEFEMETADAWQERYLGLGKRKEICEKCGMLFEFSQKGEYVFCMRDMKFPLDFIWILDYSVVSVVKDVPCNFEGNVNPHIPANKVLEINAGMAEKCGIKKGDKIHIIKGENNRERDKSNSCSG